MYIISKRKDYFDYLTQIYGIDKAVVYHRKPNELGDGGANGEEFDYSNEKFSRKIIVTRIDLWFCDEHSEWKMSLGVCAGCFDKTREDSMKK